MCIRDRFIISIDTKNKAFNAKPKRNNSKLFIFADTETLIAEFFFVDQKTGVKGKREGICEFKIVDGIFPDYKRVIPNNVSSSGLRHFAFDARKIETFKKASALLSETSRGYSLGMTFGDNATDPITIHLADKKTPISGVLMPLRSMW